MKRFLCLAALVSGLTALVAVALQREDPATPGDAPFMGPTGTAVFSGGCFWGLQAAFDELPGVVRTRAGYSGGTLAQPTYHRVVVGGTGHAEAVEVVFDPSQVSYADLVRHFFAHHRPAVGDPAEGYATRHYRSAIFTMDEVQRAAAGEVIAEIDASGRYPEPVATRVEALSTFWEAEAEHQNYLAKCAY